MTGDGKVSLTTTSSMKKPTTRLLTTEELEQAGIPQRYWGASLSKVVSSPRERERLLGFASSLTQNKGTGSILILTGTYGSGKTSAASAVCKLSLCYSQTVLFVTAADFVRRYIHEAGFAQKARTYDLLILDNLNTELSHSEWSATQLEDVLRDRYGTVCSTVITTNLPESHFGEVVNGAVMSLLDEIGLFVRIHGKSWRKSV